MFRYVRLRSVSLCSVESVTFCYVALRCVMFSYVESVMSCKVGFSCVAFGSVKSVTLSSVEFRYVQSRLVELSRLNKKVIKEVTNDVKTISRGGCIISISSIRQV